MDAVQVRQVSQNETVITYTLIRKNVKNINLSVKADESVHVSAHWRVPEEYIDDFIRSRIPFILQAIEKFKKSKKSEAHPQLQFISGEQIPFLGQKLTLQIAPADYRLIPKWIAQSQTGDIQYFSKNKYGEAVFCQDGRLHLHTTKMDDTLQKQHLYEAWQKIQAGMLCTQISKQYYPVFQTLGVAYPTIKIRKMTSRWGSCIPQKQKITFNSLLIEKPVASIEYVVVHEFSHFIHPDHSKAFHHFVEQILPDWRERKARL